MTIIADTTDTRQAITKWARDLHDLYLANTAPVESMDDPRAALVASTTVIYGGQRIGVERVEWAIQQELGPEMLARDYFKRFVTKPDFPLELPGWADRWNYEVSSIYADDLTAVGEAVSVKISEGGIEGTLDQRFAVNLVTGELVVEPVTFNIAGDSADIVFCVNAGTAATTVEVLSRMLRMVEGGTE